MAAHKSNKQWPHSPEALINGEVTYLVKFYGFHEVEQSKGIDAVKEAATKVKIEKQMRKTASGQRSSPKVELVISLAGLVMQDPKTKAIHFKFPLKYISYCADDKVEKKLFAFIVKDTEKGTHACFVLGNERSAEEITLSIGQAFDLAYRQFLEKSDQESEMQKQLTLLRKQIQSLQEENSSLKLRVKELEDAAVMHQEQTNPYLTAISTQQTSNTRLQASVGRKLENLLYEDASELYEDVDRKVDVEALYTVPQPRRSPWPTATQGFGGLPVANPPLQQVPEDLLDLQAGFSGFSMNGEELTLDSFDPLRAK